MLFWNRISRAFKAALIELRSAKSINLSSPSVQYGDIASPDSSKRPECKPTERLEPNPIREKKSPKLNLIKFRRKRLKIYQYKNVNVEEYGQTNIDNNSEINEWTMSGVYDFLDVSIYGNYGVFRLNFDVLEGFNFTFSNHTHATPISLKSVISCGKSLPFKAWRILNNESRHFSQDFTINDFEDALKVGEFPLTIDFDVNMVGFARPRNAKLELTSQAIGSLMNTSRAPLDKGDHYLINANTPDMRRTHSALPSYKYTSSFVPGHWRKTKSGNVTWVKPHFRK